MNLIGKIRRFLMNTFMVCILSFNKVLIKVLPFKRIVKLYSNNEVETEIVILNSHLLKGIKLRTRLERAVNYTNYKFVCYEQALTVLLLAKFYRIPVSMHYAIKRENDQIKAHAWTCIGVTYISGYQTMEGFKSVYQISYYPKSLRNSRIGIIRILYFLFRTIYHKIKFVLKLVFDGNFRSIQWNLLTNSNAIHQTTTYTSVNRYPEVFNAVREHFLLTDSLKILSFGCSTGEEVETLRNYFPKASIVGADINRACIKKCRNRFNDNNIKFIKSSQEELKNSGIYDAIFCMAVLQRLPHKVMDEGITNIEKFYPFKKFDEQLNGLDMILKQNGLLIVHYTQYNFLDSSISYKYKPITSIKQSDYPTTIFNKNGIRVEGIEQYHSIYIKVTN